MRALRFFAPLFVISLAGCMVDAPADDEFDEAVVDLQDEFGGDGTGKADIFGYDECDVLRPILAGTDAGIRSGFFFGVESQVAFAGATGFGGFDVVFDLYHHQMTVSRYYGAGVALALAGISVEVYAGFATGFEHGVSDWDGYFVTANLEIGLPFLREFFSLNPNVFVSAVDNDGNGLIGPTEIVAPPEGVYGFGMGIEVGVEIPTGLPVSGSLVEGLWEPHDEAIRWYYDRLSETRFARIGSRLNVHLVDHHTGEACDADWPYSGTDEECVIEFGEPDWNHTRRALHMAYGICTSTGGCEIPIAWPMSAAAIGVGAVRDIGGNLAELCPDLADSGEGH